MKVRTSALSLPLLIVLMVCLQTPIAGAIPPPTPPPPAELLWMNPIGTNDIALSKDGQYVAAVGPPLGDLSAELRFYSRSSGTPVWTYLQEGPIDFLSVAISADGDCVAIGTSHIVGGDVRFWKNAKSRTPGNTDPTWTSGFLHGPVEYRSLAISNDGNYLVAGNGSAVFYWKNARGVASGSIDVAATWSYYCGSGCHINAIDMSSNGNYVVAGTGSAPPAYKVMYWKEATTRTSGDPNPNWISTDPFADVVDVAVSDDGNYVASADPGSTVYYWANARSRGPSETGHTWRSGHWPFLAIDMSSDGDKVIAGGYDGVHFWSAARTLTGKPQDPSWSYSTASEVHDVAINDAGDYMAAANDVATPYVYFFDSTGDLKWTYEIFEEAHVLSISSDGGTLAIGTGQPTSRYLVSTGYSTPTRAVGGVLLPADKLALLSPWMAIALAALTLTVFATKRRRKP